jgi:hypothetical protein
VPEERHLEGFEVDLRGLERLKVTSGCLMTLIGTSCEQQQLDRELWRFVVCCEEVLKEKKRSLSRQTSVLGCFKSSLDMHRLLC